MRLELLGDLGLVALRTTDISSDDASGTGTTSRAGSLLPKTITSIRTALPSLAISSVATTPVPASTEIVRTAIPQPGPPPSSSWAQPTNTGIAPPSNIKEVVQQNLPVIATTIYNELPTKIQDVVKPLYNEVAPKPKVLTQSPAPTSSVSESWNAKEVPATTEAKTVTPTPTMPTKTPDKKTPEKDNTGLYVGLTMGALAIVTAGIMFIKPSASKPRRVSPGLSGVKRKKRKAKTSRSAAKRKVVRKRVTKRKKSRR